MNFEFGVFRMALTWTLVYLTILAQHFADGYAYNTLWMAGAVPLLLRLLVGHNPNYFVVNWSFLIAVILLAGGLFGAFMNVTPQLSRGVKEIGRDKKNTIKASMLFLGLFFFSLLMIGMLTNPFSQGNVSNNYNLMN